jgi:hypothetical protein
MYWIYEHPPFTKKEKAAYLSIKRRLKDKKFVLRLIKLISLYLFLKRTKPTTVKEVCASAFYDRERQKPIFDEASAKKVLQALSQKGGETHYPFTDTVVKGILRDYTPPTLRESVGSLYGAVTGTVDTLKESIPFADLASEVLHGSSQLGVTTANDVGELIAGPIGAAAVAPFTAVAAGLASGLSTVEGDLGGAVAHLANWVPGIGIILNKAIIQGEHLAKTLKNHETLSETIPYMTEYHEKIRNVEPIGGKRFSTRKRNSYKWKKTQRKKSVIH